MTYTNYGTRHPRLKKYHTMLNGPAAGLKVTIDKYLAALDLRRHSGEVTLRHYKKAGSDAGIKAK